jgi:glutamate 5-kinase
MPALVRQNIIAKARRIVVKVGTNALCDANGRLDPAIVSQLAQQIADARKRGVRVILVASGAVGAGIAELDLEGRPRLMSMVQATAAVGQGRLMQVFHDAFKPLGAKVAQVLLLRDDFEHRRRYLNIRNTLGALESLGVTPIINENDAVGGREITIGDNDVVAALLTNMMRADLLVLLSNVEGVIKDSKVVEVVEQLDENTRSLAVQKRSSLGTGGMGSKMSAANMVAMAGEPAVIASARMPGALTRILAGETVGTLFLPAKRRMSSRARWIAHASKPLGKIMVDEGAAKALVQDGRSLLPSGVTAVFGEFGRGDTVSIIDINGRQIARGLTNYSSADVDRIKRLKTTQIAKILGAKRADEVVHRNNLTLA